MALNNDMLFENEPLIQHISSGEDEDRFTHTASYSSSSNVASSSLNNSSLIRRMCDPRSAFYRYFALVFICLLSFGSYFCYDYPASLQDHFKKDLHISTVTFTAFYSWYSWPNVILCFFGGYLIDRVYIIE